MGKTQGSKKQGLIIHRLSIYKSPSTVSSKFLPEKKREKERHSNSNNTLYRKKKQKEADNEIIKQEKREKKNKNNSWKNSSNTITGKDEEKKIRISYYWELNVDYGVRMLSAMSRQRINF